ncbi:hypothetical protein [Metabacillus niabensis]|uniref:DUF4868 domain-containing protein n=1 Tax=Metabacillus niabensis TaxID=324854 RepID=A0ABT9Z8K6_9BACI|nr:hypothetical protein [Metabacillus niabensis]MDQ0228601.1 hypothetical protein [Metabacillus niabensis]
MKDHLYQVSMRGDEASPATKFKDLKYLIRDSEVDSLVAQNFPLSDFNPNERLLINGSEQLLICFEQVDEEKLDFIEELKNVKYVGLSDDREIILRFNNEINKDGFNATAIYDFTYDFLDDVFHMGKFSRFCITNSHYDLLKENIEQLLSNMPTLKRQYRFLKNDDKWFLRGITSTRYNNYDNHLALYLTFISLHQYAKINQTTFIIDEAYLTDSEVRAFFRQKDTVYIQNVGELHFGAYLSNNEIREGTFSLELRYTLTNQDGKSFSGISDYVFNLSHSTGINNMKEKLFYSDKINDLKTITLTHIHEMSKLKKLSEDQLYLIFTKIINSTQKLGKPTRDKVKEYKSNNILNNSMTLIEALDKISEITTDIDERLHLERIYNEVIQNIK